jgi:hypothetical protein
MIWPAGSARSPLKHGQSPKQCAFWQAGCLALHWESCSYTTGRGGSKNVYSIIFTIKPAHWGMRVWGLVFILLQTPDSYTLHNPVFHPIQCNLMNSVLGATAHLESCSGETRLRVLYEPNACEQRSICQEMAQTKDEKLLLSVLTHPPTQSSQWNYSHFRSCDCISFKR